MKHREEQEHRDDAIRKLFESTRKIDRAWAPDFRRLIDRQPQFARPVVRWKPLVALAAVLAGKIATRGKTTSIVISGGNVDTKLFAEIQSA